MFKSCGALIAFLVLLAVSSVPACAQSAGAITGTVTDESGAVIPNATVTITNKATGAARSLSANAEGLYSAPALLPGDYEVRVEIQGFRTLVRDAQVLAGSDTTVNMTMNLGESKEVVTVEAATAQINYDSHTVAGVIERQNIQELPLNGRSFLQLASLEPGVQVYAGAEGARNAPIQIAILGQPQSTTNSTLISLDGLSVMDLMDGGDTSMNFSQEIVQEFQISSANFDLATGITAYGAVNIVSRSGGNELHGSGYFFFRDHNMAAYPALKRSVLDPNPFFARRNPGVWVGGPIIKDRLFFFASYEYQNQVQAVPFQPDLASIAPLAATFSSPQLSHNINGRFDYRVSSKHTAFIRYTLDRNTNFGLSGGVTAEPSQWVNLFNWSNQFALGVISTLTPNVVNDFRLGYRFWNNTENVPTQSQCTFPCIGYNLPSVGMVGSSVFSAGVNLNSKQNRIERHYEPQDTLSWQKGSHRLKFGGDLDVYANLFNYNYCPIGCMSVYSVETTKALLQGSVSTYMPNLPTVIASTADLLNLPILNSSPSLGSAFGAGNTVLPGPYHQDSERRNLRPHVYAQDSWKVRPNLTVNFGLGYSLETGVFNSDIPIPGLIAPIFGGQPGVPIAPTPINKKDFQPAFGFAWSIGKSGRTVIRGGGGEYWDTMPLYEKLVGLASTGPLGDGRVHLPSTAFTNTFPGIVAQGPGGTFVPLAPGAPVPISTFTTLTLGDWNQIYAQQLPGLSATLAPTPPSKGPFSVTAVDVSKTGSEIFPPHEPLTRAYQTSLGVQRDLGHDMVLTADWARRQFENIQQGEIDLNHFSEFVNGVRTPVVPACTRNPDFTVGDQCSTGGFTVFTNQGREIYEGLLVKLQKRFTHRYQFTASYALQNDNGNRGIVNFNNYFQSYGPQIPRHNLNVSGIVNLPWGFELAINSSIISRNPVAPVTTGIDLSGTGATGSGPLPGVGYRCFPLSCGKSDLASAVSAFNTTYAGTKAPNGATIPKYILPPDYQFGDPTFAQDFRLAKTFSYKERYKLTILGEMFNAFNIANLTLYPFNLDTVNPNPAKQTYAFGQPTQRASQIFLSSGPRATQVGARLTF